MNSTRIVSHSPVFKRLFLLKAATWRSMRKLTASDLHLAVLQKRYKALNTRIHLTMLEHRRSMEFKLLQGGDVKKFYKYINSLIRSPPFSCPLKTNTGVLITDSLAKASLYNKSLGASYFTHDNKVIPNIACPPKPPSSIETIFFPLSSVLNELKKLKHSRTTTPDGFSSHTLLTLGPCLAQPLSCLFEYLFSYHYIPMLWKHSYINPIYKKGSRFDPANYRPIAITSIFCRIMERIIHKQISSYLFANSLLYPSQHGFQSGKTSLLSLIF